MVDIHFIAQTVQDSDYKITISSLSGVNLELSGLSEADNRVLDMNLNFVWLTLGPYFDSEWAVRYRNLRT